MADINIIPTPHGLELHIVSDVPALAPYRHGHPVHIDLTALDTQSPQGRSLQTPLMKALGVRKGNPHRPRVLDATGGFGEDAWIMASHGCDVTVCERQPQVVRVLEDALQRAAETQPDIAARIRVAPEDARQVIQREAGDYDVIHLDPMFPAGRKTAERKPLRVLRLLVGDDADAAELLQIALRHAKHRVIVKRPAKAARLLDQPQPVHSHKGNAVRYDVYVNV